MRRRPTSSREPIAVRGPQHARAAVRRRTRAPRPQLRIDRRAVVRAGGGGAAAGPTCQILPPNFPGYVRYCPYGAPDSAPHGASSPPRALRACASSCARSRSVTRAARVRRRAAAPPRVPRAAEGYPRTRTPDFQQISDSRCARRRACSGGPPTIRPRPTSSSLSAARRSRPPRHNNLNYAQFCDPAIDALMRAAASTQPTDPHGGPPVGRSRPGTRRAAPWLPLYNRQRQSSSARGVSAAPLQPDARHAARPALGALGRTVTNAAGRRCLGHQRHARTHVSRSHVARLTPACGCVLKSFLTNPNRDAAARPTTRRYSLRGRCDSRGPPDAAIELDEAEQQPTRGARTCWLLISGQVGRSGVGVPPGRLL